MRLDPGDFVFVRANAVQIGAVGARKQIRRLKEVNVRVDVARQNEFADATDLFTKRSRILFAHRDAFDLIAVDHNRRVRQYFAVSRINHSCADERNLLSARRCSNRKNAENDRQTGIHNLTSNIKHLTSNVCHSFDSGTAFAAALKPILECVPSQKGFSVDAPQRQSAIRFSAGNLFPSVSISSTSPVTMYGPFLIASIV